MMKYLPIRWRLSIWYFAMIASASVLLSTTTWWMLRSSVDAIEYHDLQERADDVQKLLNRNMIGRSAEEVERAFDSIYSVRDDGKWLQVRDQEGNWIYRSRRMIAENPELPLPDRLPKKGLVVDLRRGTRRVRLLAYPVVAQGRPYSVQTGVALDKSGSLLTAFRTDLFLLTPAVVLLAAIGGHFMSRRALRPVATLANEARRINERNLDVRLPVPPAADEISDLSRTLNQMLERIDKAFASVRAFTGNASHELRTPISLLRTEIEVALYRPRDGDDYRATLTRLHEETLRMTDLVENLLSLARADGGAEAMTLAPIRVSSLFQRLERAWKAPMQHAVLDLRFENPEHDLIVLGDPAGLPRLLSILLENAGKYTNPGGSVMVSATSRDIHIVLAVRDTGIGISPEHTPRIFERFYRAEQSGETVRRGSGLGLALAKWIAERHGTQLKVESTPGQGSCFSLSLKRTDVPVDQVVQLAGCQ
jgi:heavy metal sensor kinase